MKTIYLLLALLVSVPASSYAQKFKAERQNDIQKYTDVMKNLEADYLQHNTRTIKKDVKRLIKIMDREIERTKEDVASIKHNYYGNNATDQNQKIQLVIMLNRLKTMNYIRNRAVEYDLEQIENSSQRELSGYRSGLNYFKTLMSYNYDPSLAVHRIPANAKRVITPASEINPTEK